MDDTYRFLRRLEHRLQILFDRQTHEMPRDLEALRTLALRMGYAPESAWEARTGRRSGSWATTGGKTELNRRILNHLLHDAFRGDDGPAVDPIVDLVLDPDPSPELVSPGPGRRIRFATGRPPIRTSWRSPGRTSCSSRRRAAGTSWRRSRRGSSRPSAGHPTRT